MNAFNWKWSLLFPLLATAAFGNGAVISPSALPVDVAAQYEQEIAAARLRDPGSFALVEALHHGLGKMDENKRGRMAPVASRLRKLGPSASWALLEQAAFRGLPRDRLTDSAWTAWTSGLVDALGQAGDGQLAPFFLAVVDRSASDAATRAAVNGLGTIGDDAAVRTLLSRATGEKRGAVLAGLGSCRRLSCAETISQALKQTTDAEEARLLVLALADVGNAWAWQTPAARAKTEEQAVRSLAASSLVSAFVRFDGRTRQAASNALMVVDARETVALIARAKVDAREDGLRAELDGLTARFAANPVH